MIEAIQITNNGLTLRGIMHIPDGIQKPPIVIMYHGFTGYKHEIHFMFAKTSRRLEQQGIASVRFDFAGSGDSDGKFSDMTFSSELSDALSIFDYTKQIDNIDKERIYLLGMSMGGAIASTVASKRKKDVKKICLWAPAGELNRSLANHIIALKGEFKYNEKNQIDLLANVVSKRLFDEMKTLDVYKLSKNYDGLALIIQGDNDEVVMLDDAKRYLELFEGKTKLHIVEGSNHTFDSEEWENEVIEHTMNFLAK